MELFNRSKNNNKSLIRQILDLVPKDIFHSCVAKYQSNKGCSKYKTYDQFVAMSFGQLNKSITLSDISSGIGISEIFIKDLGLTQSPARSTMSDGNKKRNWKVYELLYSRLITHYKKILSSTSHRKVIDEIKEKKIKLIDSTIISVCLSMFDWAKYRRAKGGIKIHTCWDDTLMIPDVINITNAKLHDSKGFDKLVFSKGTIIVEDRAYFDFTLMLSRIRAKNVFVTRIKKNTLFEVIAETDLHEKTSDNILKAETIADLYKKRWDIELFFKAIKQNLQIKSFLGTSENAVKSQIYIALICYLLLELLRRTATKKAVAFSNFVEKIRFCLPYYLSISYVCIHISEGAKRVKQPPHLQLFPNQDLFSHEYG